MKKILSCLLVICCMFSILSLSACDNSKYSYWQVTKLVATDDSNDVMTQYVEVSLDNNTIKEFWINISNLSTQETTIGYVFGASSSLKKVTIQRGFLNVSDGWYKVAASGTSKTFKITFTDTMRVNEIVFVDKEDKVMKFDFVEYVIRPSFTSSQHQTTTREELEAAGEKNSPLCAFDEQDKFDLVYANQVFSKAEEAFKDANDSSSSN